MEQSTGIRSCKHYCELALNAVDGSSGNIMDIMAFIHTTKYPVSETLLGYLWKNISTCMPVHLSLWLIKWLGYETGTDCDAQVHILDVMNDIGISYVTLNKQRYDILNEEYEANSFIEGPPVPAIIDDDIYIIISLLDFKRMVMVSTTHVNMRCISELCALETLYVYYTQYIAAVNTLLVSTPEEDHCNTYDMCAEIDAIVQKYERMTCKVHVDVATLRNHKNSNVGRLHDDVHNKVTIARKPVSTAAECIAVPNVNTLSIQHTVTHNENIRKADCPITRHLNPHNTTTPSKDSTNTNRNDVDMPSTNTVSDDMSDTSSICNDVLHKLVICTLVPNKMYFMVDKCKSVKKLLQSVKCKYDEATVMCVVNHEDHKDVYGDVINMLHKERGLIKVSGKYIKLCVGYTHDDFKTDIDKIVATHE